jgi:hypothetical protein
MTRLAPAIWNDDVQRWLLAPQAAVDVAPMLRSCDFKEAYATLGQTF